MIIFGIRGVAYGKEQGEFYCPDCDTRRSFTRKQVRRFFTLYFIPMIPLDLLAEYIECQSCKRAYKEDILSYDPVEKKAEMLGELHRRVKRVMMEMMICDGHVHDAEVEVIRQAYAQFTAIELSPAEIRTEAARVQEAPLNFERQLSELAPHLNEHGKEAIVRIAIIVAAADGTFDNREKSLLWRIGQALGMSPAHFCGVVSTFSDSKGVSM